MKDIKKKTCESMEKWILFQHGIVRASVLPQESGALMCNCNKNPHLEKLIL
jgi:hypothetical protein